MSHAGVVAVQTLDIVSMSMASLCDVQSPVRDEPRVLVSLMIRHIARESVTETGKFHALDRHICCPRVLLCKYRRLGCLSGRVRYSLEARIQISAPITCEAVRP